MKLILGILFLVFLIANLYLFVKFPNCKKKKHPHYDVCIVLGCPSNEDGNCSRMQKSRMDQAISLYKEQQITKILISGGRVLNAYSEAITMAQYAMDQGVPESVLLLEEKATNTYENLAFSKVLCDRYGFHKVLVVTSRFHCRRASFFVQKFFCDYVMIPTSEKEKFSHYIAEYFRMWNTLYYEHKLNKK